LHALTTFPAWSTSALNASSDMYGPIAIKVVVLLLVVFVLGRAAGHVGTSFAAFLAGWGALMIAAAVAGVAFAISADTLVLDGALADANGGAGAVVVEGLNNGVTFGLYTGWLVGLVVLLTARPGGLQDTAAWRASPPSRTLPVPPTGGMAGGAGAGAVGAGAVGAGARGAAAATESMADMNLVPGMPSVTLPAGAVPEPEPDPWTQPVPGPVASGAAAAPWAAPPEHDPWAQPPPAAPEDEDPWGPQPLADPAVRSASAAPQLQSQADQAAPGTWALPPDPDPDPDPEPSTEGQPFVPRGTWPRPVGAESPAAPTVEGPIVPSGTWPPSALPEPPAAAAAGSIVSSGTWPPSEQPQQQQEPMTNGSVPPVGYEQPEYSGQPGPLVEPAPEPERPGPMLAPQPEPAEPRSPVGSGAPSEDGGPTRPLWPSAWPATGGAYAEPDVYTADQVKRMAEDDAGNAGNGSDDGADADEGDDPDEANTRFW
ncbi:MAG TPA: hypothetical protein VGO78_22985, partial [Acidimicrobiales bacterium]|nr:hypothetical protein [Acidimicrobiales bacterium]